MLKTMLLLALFAMMPEVAGAAPDAPALASAVRAWLDGQYDGASAQGWAGSNGYRYQPCAQQQTRDGDTSITLLAMCGATADAGHVTPGLVDLYALRCDNRTCSLTAHKTDIPSNGFGTPGDVHIVQLGPTRHAFQLESGYTAQGYTSGRQTLEALDGATIREVAQLTLNLDNQGSADCDGDRKACENIEVSWTPDRSQPATPFWPLAVHESGTQGGVQVDRHQVLTYDTGKGIYRVPESLQRSY